LVHDSTGWKTQNVWHCHPSKGSLPAEKQKENSTSVECICKQVNKRVRRGLEVRLKQYPPCKHEFLNSKASPTKKEKTEKKKIKKVFQN
jgi:hypothetical protein